MLNKKVVTQFLNRELVSFDFLKKESVKALNDALSELKPLPDFGGAKLWAHQKVSLLLLLELKRFMLHLSMGAGKTLVTLLLIKYRKQRGEKPKAIVFVPYITSVETWVEEVAKHAPDLICRPLLGTTTDNLRELSDSSIHADLFVICYQSAVAMVTETAYNPKTEKNEWKLEAAQIREYFKDFDMLVLDEVHRAKSASALTYRMCRAISAQCEYVLGLTGTPFGKDLSDLWPQFYLIDFGETLGATKGFFMEVFFNRKKMKWGKGRFSFDFTFKKKLLPTLKRMIKNCSISYTVDEFADMLPKEYMIKTIPAPPDAEGYCKAAIRNIEDQIKGKGSYQIIESNYLQLRQLSSGFMTLKGEDSTKIQVRFDQNPKLDLLMDLILSMPADQKFVVFHHFIFTNQIISEALTKLRIKHARIWGGQKDPIGELRCFKQDPDCMGLILNWQSGSSSLNIQNASYLFVFEQTDSPINRQQGEARLWRPGQTQRVMIFDLLVRQTWDRRIYNSNRAGKNLLKELLGGK